MFMDELNKIDTATSLDSGFYKVAKSRKIGRGYANQFKEYEWDNPTRGRRQNITAGVDPGSGEVFWKHGPAWEKRQTEKAVEALEESNGQV